MLSVINYKYLEELTASSLNTLDDAMKAALRDIGMLSSEVFEDWVVVSDARVSLDKVYLTDEDYTAGARYVDFTNPARATVVTPYFPPNVEWTWGENTGEDYMYFGFNYLYEGLDFDLTTPAGSDISGTWTWQYWKGGTTDAWTALSGATYGTTGFTLDGQIYWTPSSQTDWEPVSLNTANRTTTAEYEDRYWVRMKGGHNDVQAVRMGKVTRHHHLASSPTPNRDELKVIPTDPASMIVGIRPGVAYIDGYLVILPYETYVALKTPSANSWFAAVQITKDGEVVVDYGAAAASPIEKSARVSAIKLADVEIDSSDTSIVLGDITDQRIKT